MTFKFNNNTRQRPVELHLKIPFKKIIITLILINKNNRKITAINNSFNNKPNNSYNRSNSYKANNKTNRKIKRKVAPIKIKIKIITHKTAIITITIKTIKIISNFPMIILQYTPKTPNTLNNNNPSNRTICSIICSKKNSPKINLLQSPK